MNRQKILISQIKTVKDIKWQNLKGIESSRRKIFGYLKNMPGEKNWIKPLMGKCLQNYYFPSKYLHLDFNLKEYLRMQTVRFNKKNIDDNLLKLQECINLIIENKQLIDNFFSKVTKELLCENQSLKDFYFLYLTIFSKSKSESFSFDDTKGIFQKEHFNWFSSNNSCYGFSSVPASTGENIFDENEKGSERNGSGVVHNEQKINPVTSQYIDRDIKTESYKNIIFERTKNCAHFKKIICRERNDKQRYFENRKDLSDEVEEIKGEVSEKMESNEKSKEAIKPINLGFVNLKDDILKWDEKIYYLHGDVNLGLGESSDDAKKELTEIKKEEEKNEAKALFYKMMNENKDLQKTLSIRNRFVDPLYLRRRYSYIDKLTKKKVKKEKQKIYRKHFIQSADEKKIWPDNKGLLNKKYPNPYS